MSDATVYVVEVDSRLTGNSSDLAGYKESTSTASSFQKRIVENPKIRMVQSSVAAMCGLDLKVYFMKSKPGLAQHFREGGEYGVMSAFQMDPGLLAGNNGIATYLTLMDLDLGLSEYIVTGKAYVVCGDGSRPLSRGQVWGIQEMVNCAMDVYDMELKNRRAARRLLEKWAKQYRAGKFKPPSGSRGVDIYSDRVVA